MADPHSPLSLWVVLPENEELSPGPARLLQHLQQDARYRAVVVLGKRGPRPDFAFLMRMMLGAERWLLPVRSAFPSEAPAGLGRPVSGYSLTEARAGAARAGAARPDLVIDFTWDKSADELGGLARLGLWRLDTYHDFAGYEAAVHGRAVVLAVLFRQDGAQQVKIAQAVYDTKKLASHAQAYLREKSVQLIVSALARLAQGEEPAIGNADSREPELPALALLPSYLMNSFGIGASRLLLGARQRLGLTPNRFHLAAGYGDVLSFDPAATIEIAPAANTFWGDPFLIDHDGSTWCFFEEFSYRKMQGQIAVGRLTDTGLDYLGHALKTPYHVSFPFVFRHEDDIFMIPETVASRRVEVWRATGFPDRWTLHATLLEGVRTADTTLMKHGDDWWLFTNTGHDGFGDNCNELNIYRVSGPDLSWAEPHALNPVVIGADSARNGGRLFERDGRLYRMAQDNSGGVYGYGLKVMQVETLTMTAYSETCIRQITPDFRKGLIGCHHFDTNGQRFVIDVLRR